MNPFHNYKTDLLAYLLFMDKTHYNEDSYSQMKMELRDRNFNFDNFNQNSYIRLVVKDLFSGWERETRKMFAELIVNGWTFQQPLDYKESWGRMTFRGFHTEVSPKLEQILEKYILIFESTCGNCGSRRNVKGYGDSYYCKKCYLKYLKKFRISNIDKNGFSYFDKKRHHVFWSEINNVEWKTDSYDSFHIILNKLSPEEQITKDYNGRDYISFSNEFFNFFKLLQKLPASLLTKFQHEEIHELCNSLKKCLICGRKSVLSTVANKKCLVCNTLTEKLENPTERLLKRFETQQGIINYNKKNFRQDLENSAILKYRYKTDMSFK
ncbi:hypothetical protein MKS83_07465 [Chryseobacterium sp. Y16C]|uniref:hypothetical protein n=1 Tax=Chryseobacterium sp. Y16C TaxID=2920939 RepID=UPI001F0CD11A|nr:hypothetical protein [Chryseobacterium sp. Y16C]UMQ43530.1 hypothetical protein MKS83_07465 [Chryseobacterium sp. Y16C]